MTIIYLICSPWQPDEEAKAGILTHPPRCEKQGSEKSSGLPKVTQLVDEKAKFGSDISLAFKQWLGVPVALGTTPRDLRRVWWTGRPRWPRSPKSTGPFSCPSALLLQGGLIALLLLLLVFTVALYAQRRWQKRRRIPQKSASTEATHEIHYIPSVLLGPQARESFRSSRLQAHNSVIGVPIRETPILDDYDYEEEEDLPRRANHVSREDEFGSQVTHTLDSLGRPGEEKGDFEKKGESSLLYPTFQGTFWGAGKRHRSWAVGDTGGVFRAEPLWIHGQSSDFVFSSSLAVMGERKKKKKRSPCSWN